MPLNYPAGFRGRAGGTLRLTGEPGHYRLAGDVDVRQGFYTAEFDAQSQSLERLDWQLAALEGGSLADQIALDVNVRLAEPLRIRNSTMHIDMEGTLVASGTLAQPTSEGVVSLREGGELTLGRARVRVSGGRVVLNGYPAGTPDVDFQGATRVGGIAIDAARAVAPSTTSSSRSTPTAAACRRPTSSRCCSRGAPPPRPPRRAGSWWRSSSRWRSAACCRRGWARRC